MIFFDLLVTRWIHFAALFLLFGTSLFRFYAEPPGGGAPMATLPLAQTWRRSYRLLRLAALMAALSGLAWLVEIIANMAGDFGSAFDPSTLHLFFFATQFGPVAALRLLLFAALAGLAFAARPSRFGFGAALALSTALLVSQAWLGHAAEGAGLGGAALIGIYALHVLGAAAWVGALPALLLALMELIRCEADKAGVRILSRILSLLSRYSAVATLAVAAILASGIVSAGVRIGFSFERLFGTAYGGVLFAKILGVASMLAFAGANRFLIMPRLRLAGGKGMAQIAFLRVSIAMELGLAVLVLGLAALLGITPPPQ